MFFKVDTMIVAGTMPKKTSSIAPKMRENNILATKTKPTMTHAYKTQLKKNLEHCYLKTDWVLRANFDKGKDELLFIIPKSEEIKPLYDNIYDTLLQLPEIEHPSERVIISFCHSDGTGYCSRVINPNSQDEIHMALLGQLPSRRMTEAELQNLV